MFTEINPAFLIASLFFIASGCYLYLSVVTLTENTKSKSRDDYLSAGVCLVFYSLCYGLMTITLNEIMCRILWAVGFISGNVFFSRWLLFSSDMVTLRHKITKRLISMASFFAALISVACVFSNDAVLVMTRYGAQFSYYNSLFFIAAIIFVIIITFSFLILFFRWWRESELKRDRIQALLFLIFSAFIAPFGVAADFIIPIFTPNTAIPLASLCFLPISMPFFISMRKYKTLSITVPNASGYVFNTVTIPTLVLDNKNNISLENKAAFNFFCRSVIGKNVSDIILSDGKTPEQSFFRDSFTGRKVTVETPFGGGTGGSSKICDMLLAVENDKYNDALCKVLLLRDITENEQKDKMLQAALEQANTASRAKSDFLSNMSHEIRTPMNAIIGMTAIGKLSHTIEKKDDALKKIDGASKHLLGVINDILDMSKIEANKLELSPVSFDFEKMLQKVADVINFRVNERRQNFYVSIGKNIPGTLIGDDQRLSQVITNLLGNAVKFTPEGGTIRLNSRLMAKENNFCRIRISVEDTGIGITDEQRSRLFRSFEQAETNTSRKFGGTGLGLAISKRIVEMMGGEIWVESEPGKGSKFIFTVLLKDNNAELCSEEKTRLLDEGVDWKNIRIFVVDDEPETLEFFTALSETWGISCTVASSGEEALEKLEKDNDYNIYFLDWKLPGMNGTELARQIQAKVSHKSVVLLFSSIDWHVIEDEAYAAGISKFIPKPLFPSTIVDMINECMGIVKTKEQNKKLDYTDDFSGYSILLAEDVEINREIVQALLEPTSLNVECAENGVQALDLFMAAPEKYDVIFMDIQMPDMDGYQTTQKIRAFESEYYAKSGLLERSKGVPIIAMTANVFREDIDKCLHAGMNGHVGKPLNFDEVISQLRKYLHKPQIKA